MYLNQATIVGRLGNDPEQRFTTSGDAVCNFNMATTERWKDKAGEKQEKTEWHRIVLFGKVAEIAGQYLKKGSECLIQGKLQTREWEKDGVKRYTTEIVGHILQLGQQPGGHDEASSQQRERNEPRKAAAASKRNAGDDDSDIPF
jgi:single-strand DNA-binding protein